MMLKYLESGAYVVAFAVIGLTYAECLMTLAGSV